MAIGQMVFEYEDFSSTTGINLVGNAHQIDEKIRLTDSDYDQSGAAWYYPARQAVNSGFRTCFQFQITDPSSSWSGADGLAFVIQNQSPYTNGWGYAEITNSLAIEFDTFENGDVGDPDNNHISIQSAGTEANWIGHEYSLGCTSNIPSLIDGEIHTVEVQHLFDTMDIYFDHSSDPVLSVHVNLDSLLDLYDNDYAWVGLTAMTGGLYETHDVLSWFFQLPAGPEITVNPSDTLDFGQVYIGQVDTSHVSVANNGFSQNPLEINEILFDGDGFSADLEPFTLNSGETHQIMVTFGPSEAQDYFGVLTINSNDTTAGTISVTVTGTGILPPEIAVSPDSILVTLLPGASETQTINIGNILGGSTLYWNTSVQAGEGSTLTFTKNNYAQWGLPENQDHITDNVWITRANSQGIFNAAVESNYDYGESPRDTEWAYGYSEDLTPEDYQVWREAIYANPPGMIDQPISLHLISDDLYLDLLFHSWTAGNSGGGFSYTRTIPNPSWIALAEYSGNIAVGSSFNLDVNFDATGQPVGHHYANIYVESNDPEEPEIIVPVHLEIIGAPDFYSPSDTLDFGNVFINYADTLFLTIENLGSEDLLITNVVTDDNEFLVTPTMAGIDAGEDEVFEIRFMPTNTGTYSSTLTFTTTDPDEASYDIALLGNGLEPPVISVSPDSIVVDLFSGDTITQMLTIHNGGGSDLIFDITQDQNYAMQFFGNSFANCGNDNSLDFGTGDFTIEAWINSYNIDAYLIIKRDWDTDYWSINSSIDSNSETFGFEGNGNYFRGTSDIVGTGWHHVAVVREDGQLSIVVDGVIENSATMTGSFDSAADLQIGGWGSENFMGLIDEVRIWNIARSSSDIESNMHKEINGNVHGLVGYWRFNEGSGSESRDESEYDNDCFINTNIEWVESFAPLQIGHWLTLEPQSGEVPAGANQGMEVKFDATAMYGGAYTTELIVSNNDPLIPEVIVPVQLNVTGIPNIELGNNALDFGQAFTNYSASLDLVIENTGTAELEIVSITFDNEVFSANPSTLLIPVQDRDTVTVNFLPMTVGDYSGTCSIISTDPDEANLDIAVSGIGIEPPIISVSEDSLHAELNAGETSSQSFNIVNSGSGNLEYDIAVDYLQAVREQNYALQFDGVDDYAEVSSSYPFAEITFSAWIFINEEGINNRRIFTIDDGNDPDYHYFDIEGSSQNTISVNIDEEEFMDWDWPITPNLWTHIAVTYDGAEVNVYKDGFLIETGEKNASPRTGTLFIGGVDNPNYSAQAWSGLIDEVRLWNTVRSEGQIQMDMHQNLTGTEPGLIDYWRFDEGAGSTIGNYAIGNDGILYGGPEWVVSTAPITPVWLTVSPSSGSVPSNALQSITVNYDSDNLGGGNHAANLLITSNDPEQGLSIISVVMTLETVATDESPVIPAEFSLSQNYPNPFNPTTTIRYGLSETSDVSLVIYDLKGREVRRFSETAQAAGWVDLVWDGTTNNGEPVSTGVYLCRLVAGNYSKTIKMVYLR